MYYTGSLTARPPRTWFVFPRHGLSDEGCRVRSDIRQLEGCAATQLSSLLKKLQNIQSHKVPGVFRSAEQRTNFARIERAFFSRVALHFPYIL